MSTDNQLTYQRSIGRYLDWQSADISTEYWPICGPTSTDSHVRQCLADTLPTLGQPMLISSAPVTEFYLLFSNIEYPKYEIIFFSPLRESFCGHRLFFKTFHPDNINLCQSSFEMTEVWTTVHVYPLSVNIWAWAIKTLISCLLWVRRLLIFQQNNG